MGVSSLYYAFISYTRADEKWAKWLQMQLECFRLPTAYRKEHQLSEKYMHPVFRDKTDLTSGKLAANLEQALEASRYLIVICSPNTPTSKWVNEEISTFIKLGRKEKIIPFIVDGMPHSADPKTECFPETLLALQGTEELLGVNIGENGKRQAVLTAIAYILGLKKDEIVQRDRKRRQKKAAAIGACTLALSVIAGWLIYDWYPKPRYYADYVLRYGEPQGILQLSDADIQNRLDHYTLIEQHGKVRQLRHESKDGSLMKNFSRLAQSRPVWARFSYRQDGKIHQMQYLNRHGEVYFTATFTANLSAVDFSGFDVSDGVNDAMAQMELLDSDSEDTAFQNSLENDNISRYYLTYDDSGHIIKIRFSLDNRNIYILNSRHVGGYAYKLDGLGRIREISFLTTDGKPTADNQKITAEQYSYSDDGHICEISYLGKNRRPTLAASQSFEPIAPKEYFKKQIEYLSNGNGYYASYKSEKDILYAVDGEITKYLYSYNAQGNLEYHAFYNSKGQPSALKRGYASILCTFDRMGNELSRIYLDAKNQKCNTSFGYSEKRNTYDSRGNIVSSSFLDAGGHPVLLKSDGYASCQYTYDKMGRPVLYEYFDTDSSPVVLNSGYSARKTEYDGQGKPFLKIYLGKDGKPVLLKEGYAAVRKQYDERGNERVRTYLGTDLQPITLPEGYCTVEYMVDYMGRRVQTAYMDKNGAPVITKEGYHCFRSNYDIMGNTVFKQFLDTLGNPIFGPKHYCTERCTYNLQGHLTRIDYTDPMGRPVMHGSFSTFTSEYDAAGNQIAYSYYDADRNLTMQEKGFAHCEFTYDNYGNCTLYSYYDANRKPVVCSYGYAFQSRSFDKNGRCTDCAYYGSDYRLLMQKEGYARVTYAYDAQGHLTDTAYYGADGKLILQESGYARITQAYDAQGHLTDAAYYGADGKLILQKSGYARITQAYDAQGHLTDTAYYGADGKLILQESGYARITQAYDAQGHLTDTAYYGTEGKLILQESGYAHIVQKYNERGSITELIFYDESHRVVMPSGKKYGHYIRRYDKNNYLIESFYFGTDDKPILYEGKFHHMTCKRDRKGNANNVKWFDTNGQPIKAVHKPIANPEPGKSPFFDSNGNLLPGLIPSPEHNFHSLS